MLHRGQPLGKVFVQPDLFAELNRVIVDIVVPNEGLGYGTRKKIKSVLVKYFYRLYTIVPTFISLLF